MKFPFFISCRTTNNNYCIICTNNGNNSRNIYRFKSISSVERPSKIITQAECYVAQHFLLNDHTGGSKKKTNKK